MAEINLRIDGMHCGACVRRVTQALQTVAGSQVESVRIGGARVQTRVQTENESITAQTLIEAVGKAGYTAFAEP